MLQQSCSIGGMPLRLSGVGPSWYRFPPIAEAVSVARLFAACKVPREDPEFVGDVELATSELVTNALRYVKKHGEPAKGTAPGIWLGVLAAARYCHLMVRDPYPVAPQRREASETDENGRGLLIVSLLSAAFWVELRTYDKTAHAVIAKPGVELTPEELDRIRR